MTAEGYLNLVIGAHSAAKGRSSINPWISVNWLGLVIPSVCIASRHTRSASPPAPGECGRQRSSEGPPSAGPGGCAVARSRFARGPAPTSAAPCAAEPRPPTSRPATFTSTPVTCTPIAMAPRPCGPCCSNTPPPPTTRRLAHTAWDKSLRTMVVRLW